MGCCRGQQSGARLGTDVGPPASRYGPTSPSGLPLSRPVLPPKTPTGAAPAFVNEEGEGSTESRGQMDKERPRQWASRVEGGSEEACPLGKVSVPRASLGNARSLGGTGVKGSQRSRETEAPNASSNFCGPIRSAAPPRTAACASTVAPGLCEPLEGEPGWGEGHVAGHPLGLYRRRHQAARTGGEQRDGLVEKRSHRKKSSSTERGGEGLQHWSRAGVHHRVAGLLAAVRSNPSFKERANL